MYVYLYALIIGPENLLTMTTIGKRYKHQLPTQPIPRELYQ